MDPGGSLNGAAKRNRTSDLLITNQSLYRLSYRGVSSGPRIIGVTPAPHNRETDQRLSSV